MRDIASAVRQFRQSPGFVIAAVLSLALGIGANIAIFTLLDALILRPIGAYQPERLVHIGRADLKTGAVVQVPVGVLDYLRTDPLLDGACAVSTPLSTVEVHGTMMPVAGHEFSGDCYQTLGIKPALGRLIGPSDDISNGPAVTVLSYGFWRSEFGGQADAIGQSIRIEGVPFTIIGVTPPSFQGMLLGFPPRVSFPISQQVNPDLFGTARRPKTHAWVSVFARLKAGVTRRQLESQLRVEWPRIIEPSLPPGMNALERATIVHQPVAVRDGSTGLDYTLRSRFREPLIGLLTIAGLVLLVSCLNVANLLLARGMRQRREIAIRLALGAPRWRLIRQMAVESMLLIFAGLALGMWLADEGDRFLLALFGRNFSAFDLDVSPDLRIVLFLSAAAAVALLLFGLLPAWQNSDVDSAAALKEATRTVSGTRSRTRRILLVAQVALTLALVSGAALFVQTLRSLENAPAGMNTRGVIGVQMMASPGGHAKGFDGGPYTRDLLSRLEALPSVDSAVITSFLPFFNNVHSDDVKTKSLTVPVGYGFIGDRFFASMGIPLLRGADFRPNSDASGQKTAILSESLSRTLFPKGDAVGRHLSLGASGDTNDLEVVGIVADTHLAGPRAPNRYFLYLNLWQYPENLKWPALLIRSHGDPSSLFPAIRRTVAEAGHNYVDRITTVAEDRDLSFFQERLVAWLATAFGVLALSLAAVGLYGLLSYHVASRMAEIGIRMALGAQQADVRWLVVKEALALLAAGLLAGLPLVYLGIRALSSLLYGAGKVPVASLALSVVVLAAVTALASWIPARRATAVDPMTALRTE